MSWERPPSALLGPLLPWVREFVAALRVVIGERLTWVNWWRSAAHNAAVGGDPHSQHLLGLAVDIVPLDQTRRARIAQALRSQGLVVIDEGDHLHVQHSPKGAWNAAIDRARARGLL